MSDKQAEKPVSSADANAALDGMPPANGGTGQATAQPQQEQGPDLTVSDLNALKSIIDVASSRGAFKPNEMMTVGQVYTKLEQFLAAVSQQSNG